MSVIIVGNVDQYHISIPIPIFPYAVAVLKHTTCSLVDTIIFNIIIFHNHKKDSCKKIHHQKAAALVEKLEDYNEKGIFQMVNF